MSVAALVMSDQDDPTERDLAQAIEAILGPPEGSDRDLLRPIERENLRRYLVDQRGAFAAGGRAAAAAQMRDRQTRLENGIAHLPVGHPDREKPEARIAELKAQLDELHAQPVDCAGISIDTLVYRSTHRDLSTAEEPAEADRTGQSTKPTDDQVAAAESAVRAHAEVDIRRAAVYLGCSMQHIRKLARLQRLTGSKTRPMRITSASLREYKWGKVPGEL
jgi:hypothetical protein